MDKIIAYYKLCAISAAGVKKHPINNLSTADKNNFTRKEIELYFRKKDGLYVPKESIIGAEESANNEVEELPWYMKKIGGAEYKHKCLVY